MHRLPPPAHRAALFLLLATAAACATPRPADLPLDEPYIVAVKSARVTERFPWITRFAHHTWIDFKSGREAAWSAR